MRTSIIALTVVALSVPSVAFADNEASRLQSDGNAPVAPPVVHVKANADGPPEAGGYIAPHWIDYQGGAIPATAHIETKPNLILVGTGAAIVGSAYLISLIYGLNTCGAQVECRAGSGWLYLPVVGPFITAAQSLTTGGQALAMFDGGVQVLGAVFAVAGFVAPKKFVVWQDKAAKVVVMPTTMGAGASGGVALTITNL